jgi:hypothetical protein
MIEGVAGLIRRATLVVTVAALGAPACGGTAQKTPVRLHLWLSGEVVGQFRAAIGRDVTISVAGQSSIQLTPSFDSRSLVLRLRSGSDATAPPKPGAERVLYLDHSRPVAIPETALAIEWLRDDGSQDALPARPCSRCCVSCAGVSICACSVRMPCGSCACDGACAASQRSGLGAVPVSTRSNPGAQVLTPIGAIAGARAQLVSKRPGARQ